MSVIEFRNVNGQIRYQPAHPDGRRLYQGGRWGRPKAGRFNLWLEPPKLYRSKRIALRQVSRLIARENRKYYAVLKEKA